MATASPEIAMVSATTADSHGVTFDYNVQGAAIDQPVTFGVYRSADPQFDSTAIPIGSLTVDSPAQGTPTLDQAGNPATAVGEHEITLPLADGLPPNPEHPYVLVVADPTNALNETSPGSNTASFRTYTIGVVTHGGIQPKSWKNGPPWELRMAQELREQGYDAVIPYNWVLASNYPGSAVRQGSRLYKMVLSAASQFPASDPVDVQFIGHSEGAVVNDLAILDLQKSSTPELRAGYLKDTMLDPHAANTGVKGQQYSVASGLIGWIAKMTIDNFQSRAKDPAVTVPSNVDEAEVFYQHTPVAEAETNDGLYNLWGQVPVHGPAYYFNLTAPGVSHAGKFGVMDWYLLNVVPTLGDGSSFVNDNILTLTPDPASVAGTLRGADVSSTHRPTYSGTAAPGAVVRLYATEPGSSVVERVGEATAGPDRAWTVTTLPLPQGRYRITAVSTAPDDPGLRHVFMKPTAWATPLIVDARTPTA